MIKKIFNKFGYEIVPANLPVVPAAPANSFTMNDALNRIAARGVKINSIIDIGASNGMWAGLCMKTFPHAEYLLIEAQDPHKKGLDEFVAKHPNAKYVLAAAGSREGKIYFDNGDLFGGLASEKAFDKNCIEVAVTTIDIQIKKFNLKPPYLIKLDTHGFEVPILEGASEALKKSSLLVIEQYNYKLTDDSLRYFEMSSYLFSKGFFSVDMVDLLHRQKDKTLWQMDVFYQPKSEVDFESRSYQ